jgi:muconolactone delta-isomerase
LEAILHDLDAFAREASLASRLADVGDQLRAWREGDQKAGRLAADSLDQLEGVLQDLPSSADAVRSAVLTLISALPESPE